MTLSIDNPAGLTTNGAVSSGGGDVLGAHGAFDRALEAAFGRGATLTSERAAAQPGAATNARNVPDPAQASAPTRRTDAKQPKPKDLTQLSVSELSTLPNATGAARAELQSPAERAEPTPSEDGRAEPRNTESGGARSEAEASAGGTPHAEGPGSREAKSVQSSKVGQGSDQGTHAPTPTERTQGEAAPSRTPKASGELGGGSTANPAGAVGSPATPIPTGPANSAATAASPVGGAESDTRVEQAAPTAGEVKTISSGKSKALLATLEASSRSKFVVEDDEPLTQVSRGLSLALKQGGKATLRLSPDSLGDLTIHLHVKDDQVTARLEPTTDSARHLLEAKSHELWAALEARGLSVERIEIDGSRIVAQTGTLTQDANSGPDRRSQREAAGREGGAEPRTGGIDAVSPEAPSPSVTRVSGGRLRLDAIA